MNDQRDGADGPRATDDFSRDVVTEVARRINAGSMGPHVTATVNLAPRAGGAAAVTLAPRAGGASPPAPSAAPDTLETLLAAVMAEHPNEDVEEAGVRGQLEFDRENGTLEELRHNWVQWGASEAIANRVVAWAAFERTKEALAEANAKAAHEPAAPIEDIAEDDAPEPESSAAAGDAKPSATHIHPPAPASSMEELNRRADEEQRRVAQERRDRRDDRDGDVSRGPYAPALVMLHALKTARRAAPRKETDEPAVAFLVI